MTSLLGKSRVGIVAIVAVIGLLATMLSVLAPPAPARAEVTGNGGQFVSATARILDTRNGTGGYSTPMAADGNSYRSVTVAGVSGLPTTGIGAVSIVATIPSAPTTQGQVYGRPDLNTPSTLIGVYGGANIGSSSNSATIAVASDGTIRFATDSAVNLVIDVQGYYTTTDNGVASGGFVSIPGTRLVDTRNGTGTPKATIAPGGSLTIQVSGNGGVPAGASAVAANFIVQNNTNTTGLITPYKAGTTKPQGGMNYPAVNGSATSTSSQIALSSDGKLTITNSSPGGTIDVLVDLQGYFTPTTSGGVYTPETGRLWDTRDHDGAVAAGSSIAVQVAGARAGVPTVEGGLAAVAITLTALHTGNDGGNATAWADGATKPGITSISYAPGTYRSNSVIVPVGANGKIRIENSVGSGTNFVIDLEGAYNSLPSGPGHPGLTGSRPSATNLSFGISDQTSAQVDVATGNLQVSTVGLTIPGISSSAPIGATYNSRSENTSDSNLSDANRWQYSLDAAGNLSANSTGVVYTAADGAAWQFTPTGATGAFTSPAGLLQTLARTSSDYTLKDLTSNQVIHFNFAGQPTSIVDRNNNTTAFNYTGYTLLNIVSTAGQYVDNADPVKKTGARVAASSYSNGVQTFTQTNGSASRSISWSKNSAGNITAYTDALGKTTTFGYSGGSDLTTITAPGGGVTTITYDTTDRVTRVDQTNSTSGSPGTATTRLQYTSSTETLVAGPNTDSSVAVGTVAHTDYTLFADTQLVKSVTDAAGRAQSATYNGANNALNKSVVGSGTGSSTSTGTFDQNNMQSLTKVQSGAGAASSAHYGSGAATAYLPDTSTDSSHNQTSYGYDGVGNQMSTTSGTGANAATANLAYNTGTGTPNDGTIKTATAPGNAGNPTNYGYNGDHQLTSITAPTTTPANGSVALGVKHFTYDAFGRQASQTDGRQINGQDNSTSYTYDKDDRLLTTSFSDGTTTVASTYDDNGNQLTQSSATGMVSNTFDQQNRITSTVNTAGGGVIQYAYDKMGNTVSTTADGGTVTNTYDSTGVLTGTRIPNSTGTTLQAYKVDDHGRRTDTWLGANALVTATTHPTTYSAHTITTYDQSNKVTEVQSYVGTGDTSNTLKFDTQYCYDTYTGTTPPAACTASQTTDTDKLQWSRNKLTNQATAYAYVNPDLSPSTRLTSATQSGGISNTSWTYAYDSNGNRTGEQVNTNGTVTGQNLTFNAASQITSPGYTYDGAGNLTASPGATYTYNGAEQMTSSTKNGVTTHYTYAGAAQGQVLSETTAGTDSYTNAYGGMGELLIQGTGGQTYDIVNDASTGQALDMVNTTVHAGMYLYDGIGNPVGILTDTGTRAYDVSFDPYGGQTINEGGSSDWYGNTPFGFKAGTRTDGDALVKFGLRWYLPTTGSWTQRDTLDAPLDPNNANRYAFAGDDPVNGSDPSGQNYTQTTGQICFFICRSHGYTNDGYGHKRATSGWGLAVGLSASATKTREIGSPSKGQSGGIGCTVGSGLAGSVDLSSPLTSAYPTSMGIGGGLGAGAACSINIQTTS